MPVFQRPFPMTVLCLALAGPAVPAFAQSDAAPKQSEEDLAIARKFTVKGDVLIYDTESHDDDEILFADHKTLKSILSENPEIKTLELNSRGGRIYAGYRLADIVIDFGLETRVKGECNSACVSIFLGGDRRVMERGSRIGFHQRSWSATSIGSYYDKWRKDEGWSTLFEFAEWLYVDTQQETYEELKFFIERGVDPAFAIETIKDRDDDVWFPRRSELLAAGVLSE